MHDKFTERVRKVIFLAREEASRLQHDSIGTEHLLLGLLREGEGIAATVLNNLGLDLDVIRHAVESMVAQTGGTLTIGEITFTSRFLRPPRLMESPPRQRVRIGWRVSGFRCGAMASLGQTFSQIPQPRQ